MTHVFVTGYLRSGTTLLEKLLHSHPCACIGTQPFPNLYYDAKEAFLRQIRHEPEDYPLGHLLLNRAYTPEDFTAFLRGRTFSAEEIADTFARSAGYSGWWTPELRAHLNRIEPGTFHSLFVQLVELLPEVYGKSGVTHVGSKEVFCEEFVPLFLEENVRVVLVIRDVRDVVTSMNVGGEAHVGEPTPTLYAIRQWRKSVAFALAHADDPRFLWIRYEDLVGDLWRALDRLASFLGLTSWDKDAFAGGLKDQRGKVWKGNSSFRACEFVDPGSVGSYETRLPPSCIEYVESLAFPEMRALGYRTSRERAALDERALRTFEEPIRPKRSRIPASYSSDPAQIAIEIERLGNLKRPLSEADQRSWFLFPQAHRRLADAVTAGATPRTTHRHATGPREAPETTEITYSVVVPTFNSTATVVELVKRFDALFRDRLRDTYEVILVDDGSTNPETWPTLERLAARYPTVHAVQLMRNFGKAGAVLCGFAEARGRYVVTLDDDLQQAPEDLPLLIEKREHDVVVGSFPERRDPPLARLSSRIKGWFDRRLLGKPSNIRISPYKLFKASIVKSMLEVHTPYPFIPALMYYVTNDVVNVDVSHRSRTHGRSGFTFSKKTRQFLSLLINNSSFLLQMVAALGILMALFSGGIGCVVIAKKLLYGVNARGWTSLVVIVLMTSGLILFSLGVIGEYLIRIINGIEARQPYVVRKRTGARAHE